MLAPRQQSELHRAVREYLSTLGMSCTIAAFDRELPDASDAPAHAACALEKRWSSLLKLQAKVLRLESAASAGATASPSGGTVSSTLASMDTPAPTRSAALYPVDVPLSEARAGTGAVRSLVVAPSLGMAVIAASQPSVGLWRTSDWSCAATLRGHAGIVTAASVSPGGEFIASGDDRGCIKLWRVDPGSGSAACVRTLQGHTARILVLGWPGSEGRLMSACSSGKAVLWDATTGAVCAERATAGVWTTAAAVAGVPVIVAGTESGELCALRMTGPRASPTWAEPVTLPGAHAGGVTALAMAGPETAGALRRASRTSKAMQAVLAAGRSTAGQKDWSSVTSPSKLAPSRATAEPDACAGLVASGSRSGDIKVWALPDLSPVATLKGHDGWVTSLQWQACGWALLSCAEDRAVRMWDVPHAAAVAVLPPAGASYPTSISVDVAQSKVYIGGSDGRVAVMPTRTMHISAER